MASVLDKLFAPFEGTRDPYPVAVFRIAFYGALALHFFPSMVLQGTYYSPDVFRSQEWNAWLHEVLPGFFPWTLANASAAGIAACLFGALGLAPRLAAAAAGGVLYLFASYNGLAVQTLALVQVWAILLLWTVCGGGNGALGALPTAREPRLLPALVLFQVLFTVFFSGVEKLLAGWPHTNEMAVVLNYPKGFMVRDWVAASDWLRGPAAASFFSWLTVVVELACPVLLLFKRTRLPALAVYQAFFLGIVLMLEVPPLFYFLFAAGGLLALDDEEAGSLFRRFRE
jgi:hypothetical protein